MPMDETMRLAIKLTAQDTTKQAFGSLNSSLNGLKNTAMQMAAVVAGALAFRDVLDTTRRVSDEIDMLKDNFGMSAEQASKFDFALKVVGTSAEDFTVAVAHLNKKIIETIPNVGKETDDFHKWGISIFDAGGKLRATGDVLGELREKMQAAGPGQAAMGMAFDLLGKSNRTLTEFMQLTDAEMVQLGKDAETMGQVFSEAGVKDLKQFTRESNLLGLQLDGIKMAIGQALIPLLRTLMSWLRQNAGAIKAFGEALRVPLGLLKDVLQRFSQFVTDVRSVGLADALSRLAADVIAKAKEFLPKIGEELDKLGPVGWVLKATVTAIVLEKIGAAALLSALLAAAPAAGATTLSATGAAIKLGIIAALGITLATVIAQSDQELGKAIDLALVPVLAIQGAQFALAARAAGAVGAAPWILTVTAGLTIGLLLSEILPQPMTKRLSDLLTGVNWGDWLAIATVVGATVAFGPAGLALSIPGVLAVKWGLEHIFGGTPTPPTESPTPSSQVITQPAPGFSPVPIPTINQPQITVGGIKTVGTFNGIPVTSESAAAIIASGGGGSLRLLAEGGLVTRPTLAMVGERGPEAIVPLGRSGWSAVGPITININGNVDSPGTARELAEQVATQIVRRMRGFGQPSGSPTSAGGYY